MGRTKVEFIPPTDMVEMWHTYCTRADTICQDFRSLNLKTHIEAIKTLLCLYVYHKQQFQIITTSMVAKITGVSKGSEYRKLHIMAGKKIIKEDHSTETGRVFFILTPKTCDSLDIFLAGLLD